MRQWRNIGMIVVCLLLAACGSDNGDSTGDATPDSSLQAVASPTVAPAESTIGTIVWSESSDTDSGEPVNTVAGFSPNSPAIVASIEVTNITADTEFTATWILNDQPIEGSDMHVTAQREIEQGWVTFKFTREDGTYPIGQLGVVITSSDGELREGSVEIAFP